MGISISAGSVIGLPAFSQDEFPIQEDSILVQSPEDLVRWYEFFQSEYLILVPPADYSFTLDLGVLELDPVGFPKSFLKNVDAVLENGVVVHPVRIIEDPMTRKRLILNLLGVRLASVPAPTDYDPFALSALVYGPDLFNVPGLNGDPSRMEVTCTLVLSEDLEKFVETSEQLMAAESIFFSGGGGGAMMAMSGSSTTVQFCAVSLGTTSTTVSLSYPTNEINQTWDIFSFDADDETYDGYDKSWELAESALVLTGSTDTSWTDLGQNGRGFVTTVTNRFYAAASSTIDDDSDGLSTGTELFLLGTNPDDVDTDGDGLVDGASGVVSTNTYSGGVDRDGDGFVDGEQEAGSDPTLSDTDDDTTNDGVEWLNGTDPSNSDTNAPSVQIVYPANLQSLVLIP